MVRGQKNPAERQVKQQITQLRRDLHGYEWKTTKAAPTPTTKAPWASCILNAVIENAGVDTFYSAPDLISLLQSNVYGFSAQDKDKILIKVKRVRIFGTATASSTGRPSVSLNCSSLVPSLGGPVVPGNAEVYYGVIKRLSNQGRLSEPAQTGYVWPLHMADVPLNYNTPFTIVSASGNEANTSLYFYIEWSMGDAVPSVAP
jgi:hypothetical protein